MMSPTAALARYLLEVRHDAIPAAVRERALDLLLDHAAVSVHGADMPWSKIIIDYVMQEGTQGNAVVYGAGRASAAMAALANGTIAHGIELDDTHEPSMSHPGAVVFAAALAQAQAGGNSGREVITAVTLGYEAMGRIGAALNRDLMRRGFHPTALSGAFGASTAAAALLGLSPEQLQSAWGIVTSMASGSMAFTEDSSGTMVKRLHAGWPAHNGVLAARLASLGFTGPRNTLESQTGYIAMFSPAPEREKLDEKLGEQWVLGQISIKPYACCRFFHALIDAIDLSRRRDGWTTDDVESVRAFGPRMMIEGHMDYRPNSVMAAQYSLPYSVAVALAKDPRDPRSFGEDAMREPGMAALADKVAADLDAELDALFPAKFPSGVEIRLHDGSILRQVVLDSTGTQDRPMGRPRIIDKLTALTSHVLTTDQQAALIKTIEGFDQMESVEDLMRQLEHIND